MTVNLPPTVESSIRHAVLSGQFASMDDAMTEAARLLLERLQSRPTRKPAVTPDDLHRQMLADGLLSQLPDDTQDIDDDQDDEPVTIEGEPLSETIIRERG